MTMVQMVSLELAFSYGGQPQVINPVILRDEEEREVILVDCGYPDFEALIEEAAGRHNITPADLTRVIVTHHDLDHMGSLAALKENYPRIEIIAHEIEKPYIEGRRKSLRLEQAESTFDALPEAAKAGVAQFIRALKAVKPAPVDRTVRDGERLPWCGGIEIVHTPGHMPGHLSLYLPAGRILIAGDAVVIEQGELNIANPHYALNLDDAVRSVQRLTHYDIAQLQCYHGGLYQGDAVQALRRLAARYAGDEA
jgi:glyoxylase-like metal-dependent hydrolase (beta-lactamase superfamily II)